MVILEAAWGGARPPQWPGVAIGVPLDLLGVARMAWGWLDLAIFFLFFFEIFLKFFFKKKISIFIYFLINFYYFIKMDMSAPRVANKMAARGPDVAFDGIC